MKRRIAIIFVFLLVGALVNIAVAWRCIASEELEDDFKRVADTKVNADGWSVQHCARDNWERVWGMRWSRTEPSSAVLEVIPAWSHFHHDPQTMLDGELFGEMRTEYAAGWPYLALAYMERGDNMETHDEWTVTPPIESWWWPSVFPQDKLPLRPTWPGFYTNTLLYAGTLWLILGSPFTIRRLARRWRRCCESCGYPIGISAICTECGKPVSGQRVTLEATRSAELPPCGSSSRGRDD